LAEEFEKLRTENSKLEQLLQSKMNEIEKLQNKQFNSQKENSILKSQILTILE
jgi:predicted nuclease with TOPRIM domain